MQKKFQMLGWLMMLIWEVCTLSIQNGEVNEFEGCNITMSGEIIMTNGVMKQHGLLFGIVNYECQNDSGIIVSKLECLKCGIFCRHNDLIEGCNSYWVPMIIGIIAGGLTCLIVALLGKTCYMKCVEGCIDRYRLWVILKQDKEELQEVIRLEKRGIKTEGLKLTPSQVTTKSLANKLEKRRLKQLSKLESWRKSNARSEDKIENQESDQEYQSEDSSRSKRTKVSHGISPTILIPITVVTCFLGSSMWLEVSACDQVMWISSEGKICQDNDCHQMQTHLIFLQDQATVCFRSMNGPDLRIRHVKSERIIYWNHVYDTAAWEISTSSYSRCRGTNECMGYGYCQPNSWHDKLLKTDDGLVHGYGCRGDTVACDFNCGFKMACTWFKWRLRQSGSRFKVYKESYESWEVTLEIVMGLLKKQVKLSPGDPEEMVTLSESVKIPVRISSISLDKERLDNGLIVIDGLGYNVEVASQNLPNENLIGDFQIDARTDTYAFNAAKVSCIPQSCKTTCNFEKSKVAEVINNLHRFRVFHPRDAHQGSIIVTKHEKTSITTVTFNGIRLDQLYARNSICSISILSTFSCTQCLKQSFFIYQANNIRQEGILSFSSNCTFTKSYLSCNSKPNQIELIAPEKYCQIIIPATNQTLNITFDLSYLGKLDYNRWATTTQMDVITELEGLVTSPNFIQGLLGMITSFSIISIILTVVFKCIRIIELNRLRADANRV